MDQISSQILCILFIAILLCGCSTYEERTCSTCETFFLENDHFVYPERTLEYTPYGRYVDHRDSATIEKNETTYVQKRLLTPREYKYMKNLLFCFIGKERDYVLSYFKDFRIEDFGISNSNDFEPTLIFITSQVCQEKIGSKEDIYKCYSNSNRFREKYF